MAYTYLSDAENTADLVSRINANDREAFDKLEHTRIEAVFDSRIFVIYKPRGLEGKAHRPPEILTTVKVLNYECNSYDGATIEIEDLNTGARQTLTHVPARVFDHDIFMSVPAAHRLRWDARPEKDGSTGRSLSYAVLIKSRNRSDWFSSGVTYVETPNRFREMFPGVELNLNYY